MLRALDDLVPNKASAPGKIILTGEYAVVFGYPGIAVPAPLYVTATFTKDPEATDITVDWNAHELWIEYAQRIIDHCLALGSVPPGTLSMDCSIPLGKGMGSSTALVVAIAKCVLGNECKEQALAIEDAINPGHSGIDFAVIWNEAPVKFIKGSDPELINLPNTLLQGALLIDTGEPNEQTPELISWVTERKSELEPALKTIGMCSERLLDGENLANVIREHHQAQATLGVVTEKAKKLITKIEQEGGSAKVIGAGSRTGGCGMVLALDCDASVIDSSYSVFPL